MGTERTEMEPRLGARFGVEWNGAQRSGMERRTVRGDGLAGRSAAQSGGRFLECVTEECSCGYGLN